VNHYEHIKHYKQKCLLHYQTMEASIHNKKVSCI